MQRLDIERFKALIAEVYECTHGRPLSAAALIQWADALHDHPFHRVESVLKTWLRTKTKPPVIADIVGICAGMLSDSVESRAAADKAAFSQQIVFKGVTPYGSQCIKSMRAMLRNPKRPNKEWARKIMENPNSTHLQRDFAAPVYATMQTRQPGEDDE